MAAVLAAVAVRFLTPVGWMPNPAGIGGSPLVICTGEGPLIAGGLDLPGHGPDHGAPHDHCLFAGFSLVGGPDPASIPAVAASFAADAGEPVLQQTRWVSREQHRRQFPRGPPQEV